MGRSVSRAVRIAVSDGRPSRRKNPPGILPAAYMRSSTSIVSGKKSIPSRGGAVVQVARTCVSPYVTTHEPPACRGGWPDSNVKVLFPNSRERVMAIGRCLLISGCAARSRRAAGEVGAGPVVSGELPILVIGGSLLRTDRGERPPPVPISDPFASLPRRRRPTGAPPGLSTKSELRHDLSIPLDVLSSQVLEESTPAPHEHQEPAPGRMVLGVGLQVLGEVRDPPAEHGDLHLGRTGVRVGTPVLRDDLGLLGLGERHRSRPGYQTLRRASPVSAGQRLTRGLRSCGSPGS